MSAGGVSTADTPAHLGQRVRVRELTPLSDTPLTPALGGSRCQSGQNTTNYTMRRTLAVIQISARPRRRPPTRRRRVRRWSTSAKVIVGGAVFLAVKAALDHLVITLTVLALALTVAGLLIGRRIQRRGRVRARDVLRLFSANPHRMNPDQFEEYLAELCRRDGCRQVTVVGGAGDLAADVLYTDPHGRRGLI